MQLLVNFDFCGINLVDRRLLAAHTIFLDHRLGRCLGLHGLQGRRQIAGTECFDWGTRSTSGHALDLAIGIGFATLASATTSAQRWPLIVIPIFTCIRLLQYLHGRWHIFCIGSKCLLCIGNCNIFLIFSYGCLRLRLRLFSSKSSRRKEALPPTEHRRGRKHGTSRIGEPIRGSRSEEAGLRRPPMLSRCRSRRVPICIICFLAAIMGRVDRQRVGHGSYELVIGRASGGRRHGSTPISNELCVCRRKMSGSDGRTERKDRTRDVLLFMVSERYAAVQPRTELPTSHQPIRSQGKVFCSVTHSTGGMT